MKTCKKCQELKPLTEFHKKTKAKDGLNVNCKPCAIELAKLSYRKLDLRQKYADYSKATGIETKAFIDELKVKIGCCFCREQNIVLPAVCLDFHHLDPTKKDLAVSRLVVLNSKKRLIAEIQKCVIVCSNCHRQIHAGLLVPDTRHRVVIDDVLGQEKCQRRVRVFDGPRKQSYCKCGAIKKRGSFYCSQCKPPSTATHPDKIKWPSQDELEKLVWTIPCAALAKQLGVADTAITKKCKKYGISKPPRGYWQKLAAKSQIT